MVKNQYEGYEYIDPNHQYTYPNSTVLINKQNITNIEEAYRNEHLFVTRRLADLRLKVIEVYSISDILAIHKYFDKRKKDKKNKNPRMVYFFDIEKCKCCPYRDGCYKEGAKKKTYTETIICDSHSEQVKFQETEHFKEKMRERYKIEAKNSELKHRHGYDVASSSGLICMEMQGAMTIFAVNLKRIIKLMNEK